MVILNLKLDNVLSFYDFNINFSYPAKLRTSLIDNERLCNIPSFRYKKVNIFVGSNAAGKTSLIKCIWATLYFILTKDFQMLKELLNDECEESRIEIDIAEDQEDRHELHRFKILSKNRENQVSVSHTSVKLSTKISAKDSYETKAKELDSMPDNYGMPQEVLSEIHLNIGWRTILPATEFSFDSIDFAETENERERRDYLNILDQILKTLDPSILNIRRSKDANNAFVIEQNNKRKIIVQKGNKVSAIPYLSSGTKYGINIANMMFAIKYHKNGIYLIDEQFSYVNADIEAAILSTMVMMLGENEQIFFTTHNSDILGLGFPFHSFYFLKKRNENGKARISVSCGSEIENRNNVSPKTLIDNDVFATAPNVDRIFKLGEYQDE